MAVARWTQASARTRPARVARPPWETSMRWKRTPPRRRASVRLARWPWERSSTTTTSSPSAWSRSTRLPPRNPAPPATTTSNVSSLVSASVALVAEVISPQSSIHVGEARSPHTPQEPRGPVGDADPADEGVGADRTEVAAVGAGRPVVAQHQVLGRPQLDLQGAGRRRAGQIGLGYGLAVDLQPAGVKPHPLPRQPDHPLDHFQVAPRPTDDHQVAAGWWAHEGGDGDPLAGGQGGAHAAPRDQ